MKDPAARAAGLKGERPLDSWGQRRRENFRRFCRSGGWLRRRDRLCQTDVSFVLTDEAAPAEKIADAAKQTSNKMPTPGPARRALVRDDLVYDGPNRHGFTF
jgi:hypothetical protein